MTTNFAIVFLIGIILSAALIAILIQNLKRHDFTGKNDFRKFKHHHQARA
jgi:hypothetical protein